MWRNVDAFDCSGIWRAPAVNCRTAGDRAHIASGGESCKRGWLRAIFVGQRDSDRRKVAIGEIYTEDCTFFEAEEQIVGRDAINEKVEHILKDVPGFVFAPVGTPEVNHDHGRLQWQFSPNGAASVVTGMDVAVFERGRIRSL